jgi:hypothetical protein
MTRESLKAYFDEYAWEHDVGGYKQKIVAVQVQVNCQCGYCPSGRKFIKGGIPNEGVVYLYDSPQDRGSSTWAHPKHLVADKNPRSIW